MWGGAYATSWARRPSSLSLLVSRRTNCSMSAAARSAARSPTHAFAVHGSQFLGDGDDRALVPVDGLAILAPHVPSSTLAGSHDVLRALALITLGHPARLVVLKFRFDGVERANLSGYGWGVYPRRHVAAHHVAIRLLGDPRYEGFAGPGR